VVVRSASAQPSTQVVRLRMSLFGNRLPSPIGAEDMLFGLMR
jgi:hypothetical protein